MDSGRDAGEGSQSPSLPYSEDKRESQTLSLPPSPLSGKTSSHSPQECQVFAIPTHTSLRLTVILRLPSPGTQ